MGKGLVFFLVLFAAPTSQLLAQSRCPEGFRDAGSLSGTGSVMQSLDTRKTLKLPENATLDQSYQQKKVRATNGKAGVNSNMLAKDIPKGILIIAFGTSDKVFEQGWAVSDPELKVIERDAGGKATRYEFGMRLICKVSERAAQPLAGGCDVNVEVCYKPLRQ